jgi:hypothetical protein
MNVDVEIYCKKFRDFFEKNPDAKEKLFSTVPGVSFDTFMNKICEKAENNFNKKNDPTVSRKEVLDILDELYINYMKEINPELSFEFGLINKIDLKGNKFFEEISGFMVGLN